MAQKILLGSKVKDSITGYTGTAIARSEWLFGCARLGVQSSELKDGKPIEAQWFDEVQLEVLEVPASKPLSEGSMMHEEKPGGPRQDPSSMRQGE